MDAKYLQQLVKQFIDKHQLQNKVVAITTDTPNVMKAMWELLAEELPGLVVLPCMCHVLNLLVKVGGRR